MKKSSTGQAFERELAMVCDHYRRAGEADIEKIDPPTKTITYGGRARTILLANPWLDFSGTWTRQGGRAIHLEVKSTQEPRLAILAEGQSGSGITHRQLQNARRWKLAGAAVAFLWHHEREVRIVTPTMIQLQLATRRSLRWIDAHPVPKGPGFCLYDFLPSLHALTRTTQPT